MKNLIGNSGCNLELFEDKRIVRKSAPSLQYGRRLLKQANKQQYFFNYLKSNALPIEVPEVLNIGSNHFDMKFIAGQTAPEFFTNTNIENSNILLKKILQFIEFNINNCNKNMDFKTKLLKKLYSIHDSTNEPIIQDLIKKINLLTSFELPVGPCHGDLTLSNMIITNSKQIYFIDFLDSFIQSPVIDIVKIRQDTFHLWQFYNRYGTQNLDKIKYCTMMKYLDTLVCNNRIVQCYFGKYNILQAVNLCRILPYTDDEIVKKYLKQEIKDLIEQ